jgi:DNA-binding LacI/PurR family transcriptional regulator
MKDVARVGGVSLGTVSNVLNDLPTVSKENRKKVLEAIEKLNYSPNFTARALKTKRSKCIGLIIPDINNPFFSEFARGVEDSLQKMGYNLFLCNSDRNAEKERRYIDVLMEKMVDGLILCKSPGPVDVLSNLSRRQNIVLVDTGTYKDIECDIIRVDDYVGIKKAMDYLWDHNHRRIAMIAGPADSLSSLDRVRSYHDFFESKGCDISNKRIQRGDYSWQSGYECAKDLLEGEPPTAILAANDLMAIGAMKAIHEKGLSVPADVSVMGFDDIGIASLCTPALTTVSQPKYEMGCCSVQCLMDRINNMGSEIKIEQKTTILNTEIIVRNSVSCCGEIR